MSEDSRSQDHDPHSGYVTSGQDHAPELLAALEPFGEIDGEGDEDFPDDTKVTVKFGRSTNYTLTLGDFRRARAAVAKAEGWEP